jgi:hypothetical protein
VWNKDCLNNLPGLDIHVESAIDKHSRPFVLFVGGFVLV